MKKKDKRKSLSVVRLFNFASKYVIENPKSSLEDIFLFVKYVKNNKDKNV